MSCSQGIQRCIRCDGPTGRTTEDAIQLGDAGPFCEECAERLAAAAPQMLEALEEVEALIRESRGVVGYHLNGNEASWEDLDLKVGAALKEARGEQ